MFGHNSPLLTVSMVINTPPRKNPVKPLSTLPNIEEHNEPEPAPSASAQKQPHTGNPVIDSLIDSDSPEPPAEPKQPAAPKEAAEPALTTRSKPRSVTEELRSSVVSCDLAVEEATAKEEPAVKKESGKPSLGLPANCLESTCEFDPVESDRRDDEVSAKKESGKHSFGLPADCMMSTGEFDPVESDRRDDEPTRFEPIKEEDESDELPLEKKEPAVKKEPVKKETPKHSFGLPADCMMSTGEFDPVESDRRDDEPPTRFEPIKEEDELDELPVEKKEETPVMQRNESVKSSGEFDPVESNREEIPLPPPADGATQISAAAPAKSVRSSGEFDPVESERKDETPASKNPAMLTDTVVFSEIPENPAVSVEEVAPAAAPAIPVMPGPLEVTIPSAEENSAELLRMTNSGQNLGGLQFTEETPEEPLVASKVTAIKRKNGLEKEEGVVGKDNSIPEKKNSPLDETTVIQLDPDLLNEELEQAEEEEEEEYEERRGCWGCRN